MYSPVWENRDNLEIFKMPHSDPFNFFIFEIFVYLLSF